MKNQWRKFLFSTLGLIYGILSTSQLTWADPNNLNVILDTAKQVIHKNPEITYDDFLGMVHSELQKASDKIGLFQALFSAERIINQQTIEGERQSTNTVENSPFQRSLFDIPETDLRGITWISDPELRNFVEPNQPINGIFSTPLYLLYSLSEKEFAQIEKMFLQNLKDSVSFLKSLNESHLQSLIITRENEMRNTYSMEIPEEKLNIFIESAKTKIIKTYPESDRINTTFIKTLLIGYLGRPIHWNLKKASSMEYSKQQVRFFQLLAKAMQVEGAFTRGQIQAIQKDIQGKLDFKLSDSINEELRAKLAALYKESTVQEAMKSTLKVAVFMNHELGVRACLGALAH